MTNTWRRLATIIVAGAVCVCCRDIATASEPVPTIVRVEEDWVAYVRNPNSDTCAPQIVNFLSPTGTAVGPFGLIELNHGSKPDFSSGGIQVQTWVNDTAYNHARSDGTSRLSRDYDRLSYTVAMEIDGDHLRFTLKNGSSRTWGTFATAGISATAPRYSLDLSHYDPQASVDNTTINVGAHRIDVLAQTETRYYTATELVSTDTTDRVIHRFQELVSFVSLAEYEANTDEYNIDITE